MKHLYLYLMNLIILYYIFKNDLYFEDDRRMFVLGWERLLIQNPFLDLAYISTTGALPSRKFKGYFLYNNPFPNDFGLTQEEVEMICEKTK